ncbi:MAG: hypothetical protein JST42_30995 [Bacteroidetes bacterium]|nr:hypothetical protein [Bacteroidota bacterium]
MQPDWILTKNSIIRKVVGLFAALSEEYREVMQSPISPKISKGENYQGLPYVMLDYPRLFGREDVLAIRTFFWWGHAFSVTLHLKGEYLSRYLPLLRDGWVTLAEAGFCIGISDDEWRHEHVEENYRPIVSAEEFGGGLRGEERAEAEGSGLPFLKLSAACGLDRWDEAQTILGGLFRVLVDVLGEGSEGAPDVAADSRGR